METASAQLSNYRQSPRKVGRVADTVRGKRVKAALASLDVMPKRAAAPLMKLINSAVANARHAGLAVEDLFVSSIQVGKGMTLKRSTQKARGSSAIIRKKASHIKITLSQKPPMNAKKAPQMAADKSTPQSSAKRSSAAPQR